MLKKCQPKKTWKQVAPLVAEQDIETIKEGQREPEPFLMLITRNALPNEAVDEAIHFQPRLEALVAWVDAASLELAGELEDAQAWLGGNAGVVSFADLADDLVTSCEAKAGQELDDEHAGRSAVVAACTGLFMLRSVLASARGALTQYQVQGRCLAVLHSCTTASKLMDACLEQMVEALGDDLGELEQRGSADETDTHRVRGAPDVAHFTTLGKTNGGTLYAWQQSPDFVPKPKLKPPPKRAPAPLLQGGGLPAAARLRPRGDRQSGLRRGQGGRKVPQQPVPQRRFRRLRRQTPRESRHLPSHGIFRRVQEHEAVCRCRDRARQEHRGGRDGARQKYGRGGGAAC